MAIMHELLTLLKLAHILRENLNSISLAVRISIVSTVCMQAQQHEL